MRPPINSLQLIFPELSKEWHPTKNGELTPHQISSKNGRKVWWLCPACQGEWEAVISNRANGSGCPYCSGHQLVVGKNDFATCYPEWIPYWHPTKNLPLTPQSVTKKSGQPIWWQCEKGHEWNRPLSHRTKCPYCSHRELLPGENDLATLFPDLAKEWDYEANHPFVPEKLTISGLKKRHWVCEKGHRWKSTIRNRTYGFGCPKCAVEKQRKK